MKKLGHLLEVILSMLEVLDTASPEAFDIKFCPIERKFLDSFHKNKILLLPYIRLIDIMLRIIAIKK